MSSFHVCLLDILTVVCDNCTTECVSNRSAIIDSTSSIAIPKELDIFEIGIS